MVVVADSPGLEPVPVLDPLFVQQAEGLVQAARAEDAGVEDAVDEAGGVVGSSTNEAHHDDALWSARL